MREDGVMIDRVLLTTSHDYVPQGPAETLSEQVEFNGDGRINFVDFASYLMQFSGRS